MIEPHAPAPPGATSGGATPDGATPGAVGPGAVAPGAAAPGAASGVPPVAPHGVPAGVPPGVPTRCGPARLPVRPGTGRFLVLACVFVCAACGLVYELELVALASYLMGDSVTQASVVLSVVVFAMGIGSLAAKRLRRLAAAGFAAVEVVLALVGGCSAMALYAVFAWTGGWGGLWGAGPRFLLVVFCLVIGLLIGAEVPLLMELIQRVRRQDAGGAVADLFAADYVGALVGGLAFPFLLLPFLGQLTSSLLTGAVNVIAGGALVLGLFRRDLTRRARRLLLAAVVTVLAVLTCAAVLVDDFEQAARHAVYGDDVRVALHTGVQEIVLTGGTGGRPLALYLDGRFRGGGHDRLRRHRALVRPATAGPHARVLVLGGGDGLAARELLARPGTRRVDVVDLDPALIRLARADPGLSRLNGHALDDPRVRVTTGDAFRLLRGTPPGTYDVVVADLPDPGMTVGTKLYSQEFYGLARRALRPGGRLAVHAGPVGVRPYTFWTVETTMRAAGLRTAPYRAGDDEGFVLAAVGTRPGLRLGPGEQPLRAGPGGLRASTLVHPRH
ncbi:polyamine aminopropyltransferase [Streptomyces sp. NPDC101213]|uniref:polyamine aminopropyltransferase n=1 Tax=Streptomyces sp. NPDC101213 TaxID=3366130 RepID=UPI003814573E